MLLKRFTIISSCLLFSSVAFAHDVSCRVGSGSCTYTFEPIQVGDMNVSITGFEKPNLYTCKFSGAENTSLKDIAAKPTNEGISVTITDAGHPNDNPLKVDMSKFKLDQDGLLTYTHSRDADHFHKKVTVTVNCAIDANANLTK